MLQQLKDYDEQSARAMAEKAYQEQEKRKLEMQETIAGLEKQLLENEKKQLEVSEPGFIDKVVKVATGVAEVAGKVKDVASLAPNCSVM